MPGTGELILILIIVLVVFGAGKLPQLGEAIGRSFRNLKRPPGTGPQDAPGASAPAPAAPPSGAPGSPAAGDGTPT